MNKIVAKGLCSGIGEVCPSDFSVMEGGDHVRVRVILDTSKPLCRGHQISLDGGNMGWVSFKYERLPTICFWGGCLTQGERDCEQWITSEGSLTVEDRKYETWLRAPLSNHIKKSTIVVPGFYQQKKDSKASWAEGSKPASNPHQPSSPVSGTSTTTSEKVTPFFVLPTLFNSAAYPSVKDLEDLPLAFKGQFNANGNFSHIVFEFDAVQGKGDVMEDGIGNLGLLPREGSAFSEKLRGEGSKVIGISVFEGQLNINGNHSHT